MKKSTHFTEDEVYLMVAIVGGLNPNDYKSRAVRSVIEKAKYTVEKSKEVKAHG